MERPAGAAIPHHRGFALIGDPDCGEVAWVEAAGSQRAGYHLSDVGANLPWIVFHMAGRRKDLTMLDLLPRDFAAALVENEESGTGGPLVKRPDQS